MPMFQTSVSCCNGFEDCYEKKTEQKYLKSDMDIYRKLCLYGNEEKAIKIAIQRLKNQIKDGKDKPSEMISCTTVHELINEIKSKLGD